MNLWVKIILLTFILVFIEVFAEYLLNLSSNKNSNKFLFIGIFMYIFVAIIFAYILRLKTGKIGLINAFWQSLNIIIVFLLSFFLLNEKFTNIQILGIILAIIASILMIVPEIKKEK